MEKIYEKIVTKAKEWTAVASEELLRLQASILVRKALNYMNREDFPEELIAPFAEHLALKSMRAGEGNIESIKEGDTTITYSKRVGDLDESFLALKSQLHRFRKVGTL